MSYALTPAERVEYLEEVLAGLHSEQQQITVVWSVDGQPNPASLWQANDAIKLAIRNIEDAIRNLKED